MTIDDLTGEQLSNKLTGIENELRFLKAHFPFRIVWGYFNNNLESVCHADTTKRKMNATLKAGFKVWTI